ncbi:methylmalonyl-CoA mutase family protein [Chloroflexota bacterium]
MFKEDSLQEIEQRRKEWKQGTLKKALERFGATESPNKFYTPLDVRDFDFLEKVGFPGEYPFTAGVYPCPVPGSGPVTGGWSIGGGKGLVRAGRYMGYGTSEDTRDCYQREIVRGRQGGPNIAFDLPTQFGLDSDDPRARGEVGRAGTAIDTLEDFEVIYEPFQGERELDKTASNGTINAPASIILAMYVALAKKRGIPVNKLRGTFQNDILKEYVGRGAYIFPPRPSLRLVRDYFVYCTEHLPLFNIISLGGVHMRGAGATRVQSLAFSLSNLRTYVRVGIDGGLDVDSFAQRFTLNSLGGSMEILKELAVRRASRRMWARIMRDEFGAKNPRSWILREQGGGWIGDESATAQRPLNNLTRAVIGGVARALAGFTAAVEPPYDEPLGLGWSVEAQQLAEDAARIIQYEAKINEVTDPLAGSYYIEAMTDQIEKEAWELIEKIDNMGGSIGAIENGYMKQAIAQSAYEYQKEVERGERMIVGVNAFTEESQIEVLPNRMVPYPYDPNKRAEAEGKQIRKLARIRNKRDNHQVKMVLAKLREAASDEKANLIPLLIEAVEDYATVGEICRTLKEVFGEYRAHHI